MKVGSIKSQGSTKEEKKIRVKQKRTNRVRKEIRTRLMRQTLMTENEAHAKACRLTVEMKK